MSSAWSWFIIVGTIGSLIASLLLLFANRKQPEKESTGHEFDGITELENPLPMWWVWMFVISVIYAIAYLIYYPGLGSFTGAADWSSTGQWQKEADRHEARFAPLYAELGVLSESDLHEDRVAQQVGRRLFINNCATCHGITAKGAFGFPDLTDSEWIWGSEFKTVKQSILGGRLGAMPPWGAALTDQDITDLVDHTLKLAGRDHDDQAAARGASHYATFCVACHQAAGDGNPALGVPDLTNDVWLYGGSPDEIAFTIRHGRNGNMPGFAEILDESKAHILAAYVTSLNP